MDYATIIPISIIFDDDTLFGTVTKAINLIFRTKENREYLDSLKEKVIIEE